MRPHLRKRQLYFIFHLLCNHIARQISPPNKMLPAPTPIKVIVDPPNLLREMTPMRHYSLHPTTAHLYSRAPQPFQLPGSCILIPTFACCLLAMLEPWCSWLSGSLLP